MPAQVQFGGKRRSARKSARRRRPRSAKVLRRKAASLHKKAVVHEKQAKRLRVLAKKRGSKSRKR